MLCKVGRGWVEDFSWGWKCSHWVMRWYGVLLKNHISPRIGNQMVLPERTPFSTDLKNFFCFFPCKEQSLEFWNHSALFQHGKQFGTSLCWKLPSLGWQKHLLPENFPLFTQSFMPVVTFMKSKEDAFTGWLQESSLPCRRCLVPKQQALSSGVFPGGNRAMMP